MNWLQTFVNFIKKKKKKKSWFERSKATQTDWDLLRPNIWKVMQAREVLDGSCVMCKDRTCDVFCLCCNDSFCYLCDDVLHLRNPFHDRMYNGRFLDVLECLDEKKEIVPTGKIFKFPFERV